MRNLVLLTLLAAAVAWGDVLLKNGGSTVGPITTINCGTNTTCTRSGNTGTITASGSGGASGSGAPVDAGYVVLSGHSSGSTNERTLSAGNYTSIDTATAGQVQVDWGHGLSCTSGQALTSSGVQAMVCTSTLTASDVACSGTCVSDAEIAGVAGSKVSGAVADATNATTAAEVTCTGCVSDAELANNYSGTGTCATHSWVYGVQDNDVPLCAQPGFASISGSATIAQGGTTETASTEDAVLVGASTTDWAPKVLPSCSNATTSKLLYDNSANSFSCGTDQTGAGNLKQVVTSNVTNSTTSPATITGLTWTAKSGVEQGFHCVLATLGTATSLPRFNISGPTQTHFVAKTERHTSTSAQTLLVLQAVSSAAQTAACTTSCNTTILPTEIWGVHLPSADGTMAVQVTSSTSGQTVTVYRGSFCEVF